MGKMRLRLTVVSPALQGRQFVFDTDQPISVGRTSDNMVALDHKSVSRRHARLEPNGASFRLVDLESHNGTSVGEQSVSERLLQPGDILGFGEIRLRFALDDSEGEMPSSGLPVIASDIQAQAGALARPLTVDELFAQAAPPQPMQAAQPARRYGGLLYALALAGIVALGALAFWSAGRRPFKPPSVDVQLKAGELLPVNILPHADPVLGALVPGLSRAERIGEPEDERVAYATLTRFGTFVLVHGRAVGTTDIPVHGPGFSRLVLRVLVRGVKPDSESQALLHAPLPERRKRAAELISRARLTMHRTGVVDEQTSNAVRDLELAAKLLEAIPGEGHRAAAAAQDARRLREARDRRFDELAARIDTLRQQGKYKDCDGATQELIRIYQDPESEEYHVVRYFYEILLDEMARAQQETEERR